MTDVGPAYDAAAEGWSAGSVLVYASLAAAVADSGPDVRGAQVLDIGAGTGVLGHVLRRHGAADVVAVDLSREMLRRADRGTRSVVGDATALPFADGAFGLAATGFCFNHLDEPLLGMLEARRVAPVLLSGSFDGDSVHPAKAAVDEVVRAHGHRAPDWYTAVKGHHPMDHPETLAGLARAAGFISVDVQTVAVDTGAATSHDLAAWRLGMAHYAPFLARLDPPAREALRRDAESAVEGMPPLVVPILVLTAS